MSDIVQFKIPTSTGDLSFKADIVNGNLTITIPKDFKLDIIGDLDMSIKGEFNIETNGEMNLLSRKKNINIESLGAKIFLNSYRAKQIRNNRYYKSMRTRQLKEIDVIDDTNHHDDPLEELTNAIISLNERITKLEGLGNTINVNPINSD